MLHIVHETIHREPTQSLTLIDQDMEAFDCPYHRHPEFEVVRIDESEGRVLVGDWAGRFLPGDMYVFGGKLPHAFINDEGTPRARSRCVQFIPDLLESAVGIWPEMQSLHALLHRVRRGLYLSGKPAVPVSSALDELFEATGVEQISALFRLMAVVEACPTAAELTTKTYDLGKPDRQIVRLEKVLSHIHERPGEPLSIATLAQQAGMSVSAFHQFFRKRMGCTPGSYMLDVRFSTIARRLLESEDSISEIAFSAGFNNLSNFNRLFRQRFHCSPRDYRRKVRAVDNRND